MCLSCKKRRASSKKPVSKCGHLRNELVMFDLEVVKKYKTTKDSRLLEINKLFRTWINDINKKCPDEYEYETIKNILKDEYSIN